MAVSNESIMDKYVAWGAWGLGALFVALQFFMQTAPSVMIDDLQNAFQIDVLGVSLLSSSFFYTYVILQIPAGICVDRFGVRLTLLSSLSLFALSVLVFALTSNLLVAEISRIILGVASACAIVATLAIAAKRFPANYFALLAGLTEMLGMLGGALGQFFLARAVVHWGWRFSLIICVAITIAMLVTGYFILPKDKLMHETKTKLNFWHNLKEVITIPQVWLNGLFTGVMFSILSVFAGFWAIPFLTLRLGITVSQSATACSVIFLGAAVSAPLIGWVAGKFGKSLAMMQIFSILALFVLLALIYFPWLTHSMAIFLLLCLGLTSGVYMLPFSNIKLLTGKNAQGTAMGFTNMMCILIGSPLLQPLTGLFLKLQTGGIEAELNHYHVAFIPMLLLLFFGFAITFLIKKV